MYTYVLSVDTNGQIIVRILKNAVFASTRILILPEGQVPTRAEIQALADKVVIDYAAEDSARVQKDIDKAARIAAINSAIPTGTISVTVP